MSNRFTDQLSPIEKKKVINAWAFYDWANSVYNLTITSTIFPIYWSAVSSSNGSTKVLFFGHSFENTALYTFALSFSFLFVALLSPLLSGIADYNGSKKRFMQAFCFIGSVSCSALFFFNRTNIEFGVLAFMLGTIGWAGSLVFYNSYLPEIATEEEQDKVSAKGFALGYVGSSLLLILNLIVILFPESFGIPKESSLPARIAFLAVGIWWFGFAQYTFYYLPKNKSAIKFKFDILWKGYRELAGVWAQLKKLKDLKAFLFAFFFFTMGIQTVMYVATLFGSKELKLESGQLIATILIIQFVAIGGAYLFAFISKKIGNISTLLIALSIWVVICISAYFVVNANQFYLLALAVGTVMGGSQSLSRSTYSKLLPDTTDTTSFFSFYDTSEKIAIVLGTASYGLIEEITGNMRNSVFTLGTFFVVGLILLTRLKRN
ncbi:MAG: MFS transporter [Sphingobacteriales bacterium]|nr:MFS transporter [Sphingobacteriales bacterium]